MKSKKIFIVGLCVLLAISASYFRQDPIAYSSEYSQFSFTSEDGLTTYEVSIFQDGLVSIDYFRVDETNSPVGNGSIEFSTADHELVVHSENSPSFMMNFSLVDSGNQQNEDVEGLVVVVEDANGNEIIGDEGDKFAKLLLVPASGLLFPSYNSRATNIHMNLGIVGGFEINGSMAIGDTYESMTSGLIINAPNSTPIFNMQMDLTTDNILYVQNILDLIFSSLGTDPLGFSTKYIWTDKLGDSMSSEISSSYTINNQSINTASYLPMSYHDRNYYSINFRPLINRAFGEVIPFKDATTNLEYFNTSDYYYYNYFQNPLNTSIAGNGFYNFSDASPYINPGLNLTTSSSGFIYEYVNNELNVSTTSFNHKFVGNGTVFDLFIDSYNGNSKLSIGGLFDLLVNFDQAAQFMSIVMADISIALLPSGEVVFSAGSMRLIFNGGLLITEIIIYMFGEAIGVINYDYQKGYLSSSFFIPAKNLLIELPSDMVTTITLPGSNQTITIGTNQTISFNYTVIVNNTITVSGNFSGNTSENTLVFDTPLNTTATVLGLSILVFATYAQRKKN